MSGPATPIDVAALWQAEANWAVSEWRAQFEPEQRRLKSSGINSSGTWVQIGATAERSFEIVADQLLQRVRDVLARRDDADHIGPADHAAAVIASPLTRCALEGVPNGERVAEERGFMSTGMLTGPLSQTSKEIQQAGTALQAALSREIAIRLAQIEAAKKLAPTALTAVAPKSSDTWWPRTLRRLNEVRTITWLIGIIFTAGLWVWNGFPLPF